LRGGFLQEDRVFLPQEIPFFPFEHVVDNDHPITTSQTIRDVRRNVFVEK
jgi:hypothetical protein